MQRNEIVNTLGEPIKLEISFAKGFFEIELTRDVSKISTITLFSALLISAIHFLLHLEFFNLVTEVCASSQYMIHVA